jgi:hypothetical protein
VLDAATSNIDVFLLKGIFFSATQVNSPTGANSACFHHETPMLQEAFISKTNSILTGKNVLDAPDSNIDVFLWRAICVSSTQLNRPIWYKQSLEKPKLLEVFLSKTTSIFTVKNCTRCSCF